MKGNGLLRNRVRKRFYFSNDDNKAEQNVFKIIWVSGLTSGGKG